MFGAMHIYIAVIFGVIGILVLLFLFALGDQFFKVKYGENGHRGWLFFCAIVAFSAALIFFPLHHGDGRSNSYNDGWDFVEYTEVEFFHLYGHSCPLNWAQQTHYSQSATGNTPPFGDNYPHDNMREWIQGCKDASQMLSNESQQVTIPFKD